uniref:Protein CLEC16A-like n=1 Tax=Saccoglossus kowalevskii TaxID=10224 RepID=A0ABM0M3V7_SACKO|nr:PREDICTED: protein CLEC16A-like [Saccoglossus kowalevskii]
MFSKGKNWIQQAVWKPKNLHSLEHLKFLHHVLMKHQVVTEQNKSLLVETFRSISEILIWGDQNDSSVFDFFLEKNMLSFFLKILRQPCGRYVSVQLLQTLNILFENIKNETSLYYLLSNNYINFIIVHRFDFSDEEILAYYISFLKTLSLKLNSHTIHFFYNEHTNDFALYTEAIKFFNHPESMVRIAVRTLTLNVYRVNEKPMLTYIRNCTAAPYFSNLIWFIGNHVLELDCCVRNDTDHQSRNRLADLVAEHLDHLHYLNDILQLNIECLNEVLTDQLLNRLLLPLYVYSLTKDNRYDMKEDKPHIHSIVSLFLLSQVFLILSHNPLITRLADIIFNGEIDTLSGQSTDIGEGEMSRRGFVAPLETLVKSLESSKVSSLKFSKRRPRYNDSSPDEAEEEENADNNQEEKEEEEEEDDDDDVIGDKVESKFDEHHIDVEMNDQQFCFISRPYWLAIINTLECSDSDYKALFSLCLLYALGTNESIRPEILDAGKLTSRKQDKQYYNCSLVEKLITILSLSCQYNSKVRPVTLQMSILLLKQLVYSDGQCFLQDMHLACIEGSREESKLMLRNFFKGDELFLDMFEDEYKNLQLRPLNVEFLTMDASILLAPTGTPLTGIEFAKRLPSGDLERTRRAIRVFFMLRDLSLTLCGETETRLPLTRQEELVSVTDKLDLNNRDLIACTVVHKDKVTNPKRQRRFLVIDPLQLILVEPDTKKLGWGVATFVGPLQDVEVTGDKEDSRSLHVTIHKRANSAHVKPMPLLSARFIFDDHIRCMAAKQRLTKGRTKARQRKMEAIAILLDLPHSTGPPLIHGPTSHPGMAVPASAVQTPFRTYSDQSYARRTPSSDPAIQRSVFASVDKVSGFTTSQRRSIEFVHQVPAYQVRPAVSQPESPYIQRDSSVEIEQAQEATSPSAYSAHQSHKESSDDTLSVESEQTTMSPILMPAKSPATLLIAGQTSTETGSPKILPPTSTERVRSLSSASTGSENEGVDRFGKGISKLSFGKSQAPVSVNEARAEGESSHGKITLGSLNRLAHHRSPKNKLESDGIEMTSFKVTTTSTVPTPGSEESLDLNQYLPECEQENLGNCAYDSTRMSEQEATAGGVADVQLDEPEGAIGGVLDVTGETVSDEAEGAVGGLLDGATVSDEAQDAVGSVLDGTKEATSHKEEFESEETSDEVEGAIGGVEIDSEEASSDFDVALQDMVQSQFESLTQRNQTKQDNGQDDTNLDPECDFKDEENEYAEKECEVRDNEQAEGEETRTTLTVAARTQPDARQCEDVARRPDGQDEISDSDDSGTFPEDEKDFSSSMRTV